MTAEPAGEVVAGTIELPLPWGPVVRGQRWGAAPDRLILIHEPGSDLDAWGGLPRSLAGRLPLEAVAVDLPGHGLSDDPWEPDRIAELLAAVVDMAPAASRTFLVAAGATGLAAIDQAARLDLDGLVCLSPDPNISEQRLPRSPDVPKLFFAGASAGDDLAAARRLAASGGWAIVTSIPVAARGTALLTTPWRDRIEAQIATFLHDTLNACPMRPIAAPRTPVGK